LHEWPSRDECGQSQGREQPVQKSDGLISDGNSHSENPMALFPLETAPPHRRRARIFVVGLRPTILSLGRASELALPSLNRMVRHVAHILDADLSTPEAGADLLVVDVEVVVVVEAGDVGAAKFIAGGEQLRLVLQLYYLHCGLHIQFLFHNLLCFLSKELRS